MTLFDICQKVESLEDVLRFKKLSVVVVIVFVVVVVIIVWPWKHSLK